MSKERKYDDYFKLCIKWIYLKNQNIPLCSHELIKDKSIAIYGVGDMGKRFYEDLFHEGKKVEYMVDQKYRFFLSECEIYGANEELPEVDVLVVTATAYFDDIYLKMIDKFKGTIVSLETIINDLWNKAGGE